MADILLLATAWGPKHGGINAFNMDFATGLAGYLRPSGCVFCAVLDASREDCERAQALGVTLVPLEKPIDTPSYDEDWAHRIRERLPQGTSIDWWVGHDVTSAAAAIKGPQIAGGGGSAVIMHMSYLDYASYKHSSGSEADRKDRRQRELFRRAHRQFAVGPLLRDAMREMVDGDVTMLVPGFADVPIRPAEDRLTLITFGRMDRESERIKQGALAVAGLASARRRAQELVGMPHVLRDSPRMRVIGIAEEKGEEEQALRKLAFDKAGREINLLAQPFDEERDALFDLLGRANVALMLSWHEGFGLTGWEAIAAQVPLIVTRQSGLYALVDETLEEPGMACLSVIDVEGQEGGDDVANFTANDEAHVCDAIVKIASDLPRARRNAERLKQLLEERLVCTWENTARQFCGGLGVKPDQSPSPTAVRPAPDQCGPRLSGAGVEDKRADAPDTGAPPPLIALPERPWPDSLAMDMPDSLMLLPQQEVVRFHSYRQGLLDEVLKWALAEDERITLRLQAGEGGTGKTRVAIEACHKLKSEDGWRTGFLRTSDNLEAEFRNFLGEGVDCLVVVDYAETRTGEVVALTRTALKAPPKGQVRLLLLARDGGDWWDRLADGAKDDAAVAALLRRPSSKTGPYRMSEEPIEPEARSSIFHEALASFAKEKRQEIPANATPDLSAGHFGQILFIHLAALAFLRGSPATGDRELLDMAVGHERAYWRHLLGGSGLGEAWFDPMEQAIALLTLVGGTGSAKQAKYVLGRTPRLRSASASTKDRMFDLLRRLYRRSGGIGGLQPDLLGEHFIAQALAHDEELLDAALDESSPSEEARSALTVLTRLARRTPDEQHWLEQALKQYISQRAQEAFEVALETGAPMPEMIAKNLRSARPGVQRRLVKSLRPQLPEETANLKNLAIEIAKQRVMLLRDQKGSSRGWKVAKEMRDAYRALAARHDAAGRWKEAAKAEENALTYAEIMGRYAGRGNKAALASAKLNLAIALLRIGGYDKALVHAQQGAEILRELARQDPGAHRGDQAGSLNILANCLYDLGHYKDALANSEEAERVFRDLAEKQPDAYRANWANSLHSLSISLSRLGSYEDALAKAEQAERMFRDLAERQPDVYRPHWADSLNNLGSRLHHLGRFQEALAITERAEAMHRDLAGRQPDAYRAEWAGSLGSLANRLRELNRNEKALEKQEQAEAIYRELAGRQPEAYRADWALSLGNVAEIAVRSGLPDRALSAAERGVEVLKALAIYPNVDRDHLGFCLRVLAEALLEAGDAHRALQEAQRGERIWATIFAERPSYACEQYGKSLPVLARARLAVEGKPAAVETLLGGIESILPFFEQRPRALFGVMGVLVRTLREIDHGACAERVPAELVEQLDALSRDAPHSQAS